MKSIHLPEHTDYDIVRPTHALVAGQQVLRTVKSTLQAVLPALHIVTITQYMIICFSLVKKKATL